MSDRALKIADARMPDGLPVASCDVPVGGQAVLEGVMMRGVSTWALAVKKPDGMVEVTSEPVVSWAKRHRVLRLPVVRGVVALVESLKLGFRAMRIAANAQITEEDEIEEIGGLAWTLTVAGALVLAIGLFFVIPVAATSLIKDWLDSAVLFWLVEGVLRTAILVGYIVAISRIGQVDRLFKFHGAEHKTISAFEAGDDLTPERAALYSRHHPRCGTSFLLLLVVLAVFVFAPLGLPAWYWLVASRVLGIPLVAGIAYEIIKWAGRHRERAWVRVIMWPGLKLQSLTTREPEREHLEVAITALQAVLKVENPAELSKRDRIEVAA
ncbi:MAG TPA: DUF1385 domain-containing protein [Solirubrobacterales bacterium]|nr:DUF1385 domain-containing protein [Solirubrobacterales bacterium]